MKIGINIFLILFSSFAFSENPWGKDADLLSTSMQSKKTVAQPFLQAIYFHQHCISLADGPRSHFYPSSSEYSRQAILRYGPKIGLLCTFDRLLRENSDRWEYKSFVLKSKVVLKYDPVPLLEH